MERYADESKSPGEWCLPVSQPSSGDRGVIDAAEEGKTTVVDVYNCSSKNWTTSQALELPERILMVLVVHVYIFLNVKMGTGGKPQKDIYMFVDEKADSH